jgi:hypothetical protein
MKADGDGLPTLIGLPVWTTIHVLSFLAYSDDLCPFLFIERSIRLIKAINLHLRNPEVKKKLSTLQIRDPLVVSISLVCWTSP